MVSLRVRPEGISPAEKTFGPGFWHSSRKNILLSFSLILVSGISGTVYLNIASQPGYGLWAFLQGPQSLLPVSGFPLFLVEILLFIALACAASGLFLLGMINNAGSRGQKHARAFRISMNLLVISYAETLVFLVASAVLGIYGTQNSPTLSFGTGNTVESTLFILVIMLLISFVLFVGAGLFLGTIGSMANAVAEFDRYEFVLIAPLLLGGIFYYPLSIAAGVLGISTALTERSFLKDFTDYSYRALAMAAERFLSSRRLEIFSAAVSALILILLFHISTMTVPFYAGGTLINYTSRYLSGTSLLPMILGLVASSVVLVSSLFSVFRGRLKLMTALTFATFILAFSVYLYFSLTMVHSLDFVQFSKFQAKYVGLPFILLGMGIGMILPVSHFAHENRIRAHTV